MKSIAGFLVICLLLLSTLQGIGSTTHSTSMADCCTGVSCKHEKPEQKDKGCDSKACNRMISCTRCGFFITEQLLIQNLYAVNSDKSQPLEIVGVITGYPEIGWHPPKV